MSSSPPNQNGAGWTDSPDDAATLATLVAAIGAQQAKLANSSQTGLDGLVDRAQHQKQLLGAFGTLRIADDVPAAAQFGPFAKPGASYRIACRISNGQPCPQADTASDVRGIAIKFFTDDDIETDLLLTNEGGRSHARNAVQFMAVADIIVALLADGPKGGLATGLRELMSEKLGAIETARILAILVKETKLHHVDSVTTEHYWGSVVQLGQAAIKLAASARNDARRKQRRSSRRQLSSRRLARSPERGAGEMAARRAIVRR
ncbi:catalase [Caballeronia insecticola]|uniref:Peroxidase n=1 Tax=Caballeronia insecticola TaxID=758793 RepID=R4WNH5_9BURK|nr:catalase [Caballeronia insecticola]BAN26094.1 peroxidase [Caballeronia insecticola]